MDYKFVEFYDGEEYSVKVPCVVATHEGNAAQFVAASWFGMPFKYQNELGEETILSQQGVNLAFYLAVIEHTPRAEWKDKFGQNHGAIVCELIRAGVLTLKK